MPWDVFIGEVPQLQWLMRGISSGVAGGSSLALAWKALSVLDRPSPVLDPALVCEALGARTSFLDWFSFAAGIIVGVLLFAFVEAVVTLRWVVISFFQQATEVPSSATARPGRPLYKIL
jgi:hypothetical protein